MSFAGPQNECAHSRYRRSVAHYVQREVVQREQFGLRTTSIQVIWIAFNLSPRAWSLNGAPVQFRMGGTGRPLLDPD